MTEVDLVRIGDKVVDRKRVYRMVDRILELRARGLSQQDVAHQLEIDRTFVSRLESVGEVRKGNKIALVGFPVANKEELEQVAREEGLDLIFLMRDDERWHWVTSKNGAELLNELFALIARGRECDHVIFLGSDMRLGLLEGILGAKLVSVSLGPSPIKGDRHVDPNMVRDLIRRLKT